VLGRRRATIEHAYRGVAPGETARTDRISFDVRADDDAAGERLGIELLSLDRSALEEAQAYAISMDVRSRST
jgi:hypothetical protein